MQNSLKVHLLIYLSLLIFFTLDIFPLIYKLNNFFPSLFILAFIYWNLALPQKLNLSYPFLMGISYDFLQGTFIGIFPLIFIALSYICQRYFYQFRPLSYVQQSLIILVIFLLIKVFLSISFLLPSPNSLGLVDNNYIKISFLYALINAVTWPFIFFSLRFYRRKWINE